MPTEEYLNARNPSNYTTESTTPPTRSITLMDIPECTIKAESKFIYNRFDKYERLSRYDRNIAGVIKNAKLSDEFKTNADIDQKLRSRYTSPPRYIHLKFTHNPKDENHVYSINPNYFPLMGNGNSITGVYSYLNDLIKNIDPSQVLSEGGLYNYFYSGTQLVDTNLDEKYYQRILSQAKIASFLKNQDQDLENKSVRAMLEDYAQSGIIPSRRNGLGASANGPSLSNNNFSQFNSVLTRLSQNNLDRSKKEEYQDSIRDLSFDIVINNLCFDRIIKSSVMDPHSVFNDELRSFQSYTKQIYDNIINTINARELTDADFETQIGSGFLYDYQPIESYSQPGESGRLPGIVHAGYMIERKEFDPITGRETILPPRFASLHTTSLIDTDITYGMYVNYTVKALYAIEYDCLVSNANEYFRCIFVVASKGSSKLIKCLEYEAPKPPQSIKFKYEHKEKGLRINWEFPPNPQGDIKYFQVFRRKSVNDPFTLIKYYDFDDTINRNTAIIQERPDTSAYYRLEKDDGSTYVSTNCIDYDFKKDSEYIYAVGCADAHGLLSNLSAQFKVKFNKKTRRVDVIIVSRPHAPRCYPNMFLENDTVQDAIKVSNKDRMTIYFDPDVYKISKKRQEGALSTRYRKIIAQSENQASYKINFINTDLQKNAVLNINIKNIATDDTIAGSPPLEPSNLSLTVRRYQ